MKALGTVGTGEEEGGAQEEGRAEHLACSGVPQSIHTGGMSRPGDSPIPVSPPAPRGRDVQAWLRERKSGSVTGLHCSWDCGLAAGSGPCVLTRRLFCLMLLGYDRGCWACPPGLCISLLGFPSVQPISECSFHSSRRTLL